MKEEGDVLDHAAAAAAEPRMCTLVIQISG